jgi:hypothetical protein
MKHTLRCHGFGDVEHAAGSGAATGMHRAGNRGPKPCQPTRGLRPESSARRSVGQGSAQRGAGARLRDATVEPIKGASFQCRSPARLRGQIPRGAPLPPLDAPRFPGMRPWRRTLVRGLSRRCIPLRGRIHRLRPTEPAPPSAGAGWGWLACSATTHFVRRSKCPLRQPASAPMAGRVRSGKVPGLDIFSRHDQDHPISTPPALGSGRNRRCR